MTGARICLVTNEILGASRNGGIGTAMSNLALLLAHAGHSVTLFYVGKPSLEPDGRWADLYRRAGLEIVHRPEGDARITPWWMRKPVQVHQELSAREFDVILFQEWMAFGHACMVAKRCGLGFSKTTLAVAAHSSTQWINEANRTFTSSPEQLGLIHMERQAIALADAVVGPSQYLMDWMRTAGWDLPIDARVIPNFLAGAPLFGETPAPEPPPPGRIDHLVFFGRLEERKGIALFLNALATPALRQRSFRLTFLGRAATHSPEEVQGWITTHRPDLLPGLELLTDLSSDQAQAFLREHACVPVMPSLLDNSPCVVDECLRARRPFIASNSGGTPELVAQADRERVLFEPVPQALADKLMEVLDAGRWDPAEPANDPDDIAERWLDWVERLARTPAADSPAAPAVHTSSAEPSVSVVVTHHERPKHLARALRSLEGQTFSDFEVVVVDDGSCSEAALEGLRRAESGPLRPRVVRQANAYPGAARNAGVRHTRTERIVFLDDDNLAFPDMLETFDRASRASGADIVTCQLQRFVQDDGEPNPSELATGERMAFPGGPAALALFNNPFGDATGIYRRSVFERVGGFHEQRGVTYEDWQFYLRAVLAGASLLSLPVPLLWYRVAGDSMLRRTNLYSNTRALTSVFEAHMDPELRPLVELFITLKRERVRASTLEEIASAGPPG